MTLKEKFVADLRGLGINSGDTVLMHCSYKALGEKISADDIFEGFKEVLGCEGTLILPALSYSTVNKDNPVFNRQTTPCCVGFLPEYFRTQVDGVERSFHATHSCCVWGKNKDFIIENHELDTTPVGANSPFTKLPKLNGKVLIMGSDPRHNTILHGVEIAIGSPYPLDESNKVEYILQDGEREIKVDSYRHSFNRGTFVYGQRYERAIGILDEGKDYTKGKILNAESYLFDARTLWDKSLEKMKEEPYHFVEKVIL